MVEFHADYPGTGLRFYCVFTFQVYAEEMRSALNTGDMLESQPEASDRSRRFDSPFVCEHNGP